MCYSGSTSLAMKILLLNDDVQILFFSSWLDVKCIGVLDTAITTRTLRPHWLQRLRSIDAAVFSNWHCNYSSITWLIQRGIRTSCIQILPKSLHQISNETFEWIDIPSLLSINLAGCIAITNEAISTIADGCPKLRSVNLNGCVGVDDAGLTALARGCRDIVSLDVSGCMYITNKGVKELLENCCCNLQNIGLNGCRRIEYVALYVIAQSCPALIRIDFRDIGMCDHTMMEFAKWCPLLSTFDISHRDLLTDIVIADFVSKCTQLRNIDITCCNACTDACLVAMAACCTHLHSINLADNNITDIGVSAFAKGCGGLKSITLANCISLTDLSLIALSQGCPDLVSIDISHNPNMTNSGIASLVEGCPNLESFDLSHCFFMSEGSLVSIARGCPLLTNIDFDECYVDNEGLTELALCCPLLQSIGLAGFSEMTESVLCLHAAQCPDLRSIQLRKCTLCVTCVSMAAIANNCHRLNTIDLGHCPLLTDAGLIAVAQGCPDLHTVSLRSCVEVTHEGLSRLVRSCVHLEYLNLTDCLGIRARGFEDLERFGSELIHLDVTGCDVPESVLCRLKSQPGLTVTNTPYSMRDYLLDPFISRSSANRR